MGKNPEKAVVSGSDKAPLREAKNERSAKWN
jgi:hypothetical protein